MALLLGLSVSSSAAQEPSSRQSAETQKPETSTKQSTNPSHDKTQEDKALAAKNELSKKLLADASVVGVGIGSQHSSPIIFVYVTPDASKVTLAHIPKKYQGVPVSVVKTEPLKPQ
jgi:hypothetical protein